MNELKMAVMMYYVGGVEDPIGWVNQTPLKRREVVGESSGVVLHAVVPGETGYVHDKTVLNTWHGIPLPLFETRRNLAVRRAKNFVRRAAGK